MSHDKIDQLKDFAAKDLAQTKADFQQAKDKVSEVAKTLNKKVRKLSKMLKTLHQKTMSKPKLTCSRQKTERVN